MKKFTFILSLLLACTGITASAQTYTFKKFASKGERVTSLEDLTDGSLVALRATNLNKFIKLSDLSNNKLNNDGSLEDTDATDGLAVFKINTSMAEDGTTTLYSFETAFSGLYIQPVVDGDCCAGATKATFEIRTTNVDNGGAEDGIFYIKNSGNNLWFDMQGSRFVGWYGRGDNCKYEIIPVTLSDETVTYHHATHKLQLSDGTEITGYAAPFEAKYYADGTEMPETSPASYNYTVALMNTSNVVASGNTEFVYEATKNGEAPVTFSTADSKTWYKVMIKDGNRILKSIEEDNTLHIRTTNFALNEAGLVDYDGFNSIVWSFVESGLGVKLYNKGTGKYVKWVSGFAELVNEANASTFYFVENTNATNGFGLWTGVSTTTARRYLNASETKDNVANSRLGAWTANGAGSCFLVEAIDANADLVAVGGALLNTAISNTTPNTANETYVTAGLHGDIDKAATAATSATTVDGLDAVYASLAIPFADIDPNAVYRIRNVNSATKKYASTNQMVVGTDGTLAAAYNQNTGMDRTVRRTTSNDDFMSQLWYLEANADGTYKIKSANVGAYWCNSAVNDIDMPISKTYSGDFKLQGMPNVSFSGNNPPANDATTMFLLSIGGKHVNAFQGDDNNVIKNWQQENDPGNYWQIEKVTSIPVAIGETGYASVGYPFAVQLPAGDVKAYYGSQAANGVLTLTPIEDGIIPANTGVILVNESAESGAADVTLTITTTDKIISDNKLEATAAKRTGFEANSNYLLAKDADDQVKFLQAEITTVPANKAYLPAANLSGNNANALAFSFGETTGINTVETAQESKNVKYYDLKGRAVLNPSHGVFITNTGKKVFIK